MTNLEKPLLKVSTVFVDIDATLTDPKPGRAAPADPGIVLIMQRTGKSFAEVCDWLETEYERNAPFQNRTWPFGIFDKFGISEEQLWIALCETYQEHLFMYPDAKNFLIRLKQEFPGIRVYPATTNPGQIILAKLSLGGLAERNHCPYLTDWFGGEVIIAGGKSGSEFYSALLERTGAAAETTLMVGDNPQADLAFARAARISQVVLPRRNQGNNWIIEPDGGIYVKSLESVLDFIKETGK